MELEAQRPRSRSGTFNAEHTCSEHDGGTFEEPPPPSPGNGDHDKSRTRSHFDSIPTSTLSVSLQSADIPRLLVSCGEGLQLCVLLTEPIPQLFGSRHSRYHLLDLKHTDIIEAIKHQSGPGATLDFNLDCLVLSLPSHLYDGQRSTISHDRVGIFISVALLSGQSTVQLLVERMAPNIIAYSD